MKNTAVKKEKLFLILFCAFLGFVCISINSMNSFLYKFTDNNDVHCFVTTARCMLRGDVLYRDVYEHKGPILYFLYILGLQIDSRSFTGIALVEVILFSIYIYFMYKITELFVEKKVFRYILITCASWISCSDKVFDGGGQCEELTLPFLCITMYLVLKYFKQEYPKRIKALNVITIGACFSIVFWMKYTLTGIYLGLVIMILVYQIKDKTIRNLWLYIVQFILGFSIGSLPVIIYYSVNGGFKPLFDVYFYKLIFEYGRTNRTKLTFFDYFFDNNFIANNLLNMSCYVLTILYCIGTNEKYLSKRIKLAIIVMIVSQAFGVSRSYYCRYLMQSMYLFAIFGVLVIYFWIYDVKESIFKCKDLLFKLMNKVLTNKYVDMGCYVFFTILVVLLLSDKPFMIFDELIFSILISRTILKLENRWKNKIKNCCIWKYCLLLLPIIFRNYRFIFASMLLAYVFLLLYDISRYKEKIIIISGKIFSTVQERVSKITIRILQGLSVSLLIIVITLNISSYSKFMMEDLNNYPQYQIAKYINNGDIENPQIIYWECFDQGIYWLTDTYPPYKYFCFYNLNSDYIPSLFKEGMDSGEIDYVVSTGIINDDNFELVYYGERSYREVTDRKFYLYKKIGNYFR